MTSIFDRDTILIRDVAGLSAKELSDLYASLQGKLRRELARNGGQSNGLQVLLGSMSVVVDASRSLAA